MDIRNMGTDNMGIHIDRVAVEDIGPITSCELELGQFNLIYGHNEMGKTHFVEFLIRALFKNRGGWDLRPIEGRGRVWVNGLSEDKPVAFTTASRKKLEDYWADSTHLSGLPPRMSRLLIVKGAEVELDGNEAAGVNRQVLKELFSGQSVLETIENRIQKTVQKATIHEGIIEGANAGELKHRKGSEQHKARLDKLFAEVDRRYAGGRRAALQADLDEVDAKLQEMERAKQHHAWQLAQQISQLEQQLSRLPAKDLYDLERDARTYFKDAGKLEENRVRSQALAERSEQYRWLQEAISVYEQRETVQAVKANSLWAVVIAVALIAIIPFAALEIIAGVIVALLVAATAIVKYVRDLRQAAANPGAVDEMQRLASEFEQRFERSLSGLPLLRQLEKELQDDHFKAKNLSEEVTQADEQLEGARAEIAGRLRALTGETVSLDVWTDTVSALQEQRDQLDNNRQRLDNERRDLNVAPSDYHQEPASVSFSQMAIDELQAQKQRFEDKLKEENEALASLKQNICSETDDDISIDWDTLLRHLQDKRAEVAEEYRQQTSRILAQILVCGVLEDLRQQEDQKLQERLQSPLIANPLQAITGRYNNVQLNGDQLYVADSYGQFAISQLSTGAQEQVLLALRLGIAGSLLGKQPLFLILDDAFQYADWQRRECLLEQMVALAQTGWQVTYFTMDDHIRDLFDRAGQECFGDGYKHFDLNKL